MSSKQLAMTGSGTLIVGGVAIASTWIITAAVAVVLIGAILIRISFRRRRAAGQ